MKFFIKSLIGILFLLGLETQAITFPKDCELNKECVRELPGVICADGTPSYYTIIPRSTENILIFMFGGGACWDWYTCSVGMALTLTRKDPVQDWVNGAGIFNQNDPKNPLRDFTIVTVPYCTGDVYVGDSQINHGSSDYPYVLNHKGYDNALNTIKEAAELFPDAKKVVLMGTSAGAIGSYTHMKNLNRLFPNSEKFVISDAGTPFQPPYVSDKVYQTVLENWNAYKGFPVDSNDRPASDFGAVLEFNRKQFPHIKFALISSYADYVMSGFAYALGAPDSTTAVRDILITASDRQIGLDNPTHKVFYTETWGHTFTNYPLNETSSLGVTLADWLNGMLNNGQWENIRPDLGKQILPWMPFTPNPLQQQNPAFYSFN